MFHVEHCRQSSGAYELTSVTEVEAFAQCRKSVQSISTQFLADWGQRYCSTWNINDDLQFAIYNL